MNQKLITKEFCRYGFSCALMMQIPGLTAVNCSNRTVCGTIKRLDEDQLIEFGIAGGRIFHATPRQLAALMLNQRGQSQTTESLGINECLTTLSEQLSNKTELVNQANERDKYVAPVEAEVCSYNVKRPWGTYEYNKMMSLTPIFEPQIKEEPVKVIHLSKDQDFRNLEARVQIPGIHFVIVKNRYESYE